MHLWLGLRRDIDGEQRHLLSGVGARRPLGITVDRMRGRRRRRLLLLLVVGDGVEVSTSDGAVQQDDDGQLDELDAQRDAVGPPSQLVGVVEQTAARHCAGAARRRRVTTAVASLPQTTRRVDQRAEQQRRRDVASKTRKP